MTRRNQFDPTEFDPELQRNDMATATKKRGKKQADEPESNDVTNAVTSDDADPEKDAVKNDIAELKKLRDKWNITQGWRQKFIQAQAKVAKAEAKFDEMDAARKQAKAGVDRAIADELAMVARFTYGEQLLPYDQDPEKAEKTPCQANQSAVPTGTDEGSLSPITVLLAKEIKKIVGADVFTAAKERDEPIGFTDKGLEIIVSAGWGTIAKLEKAMREDAHWWEQLKGFGENKRNQLINTLMAFRKVHPHPEDVSTEEPAAAPNDWEQAVKDLDTVTNLAGQLVADGPSESIDFAKSVGFEAVEMRNGINERQTVTDDQLSAIVNWTEGLKQWQPATK